MSGLAGIRRTRTAPVVLAECPFAELAVGSRVFVINLEGVDQQEYGADVVFGPQLLITITECTPTARILRVLPDAERSATAAADVAPPWIGLAPPELLPGESMGQNVPRSAAAVAAMAAALLVEIDSAQYGLRGFAQDLPVLGQEIVLDDQRIATVTGIDGKHGVLHAHLDTGEEIEGPLPHAAALTGWTATPRITNTTARRQEHPRPRRRRSGQGGPSSSLEGSVRKAEDSNREDH